jgi:hypothetical protein
VYPDLLGVFVLFPDLKNKNKLGQLDLPMDLFMPLYATIM